MSYVASPARSRRGPLRTAAPDPLAVNRQVAARFEETARILDDQAVSPFRVRAYRRAAAAVRDLTRPLEQLLAESGVEGLDQIPGIGRGLSRAIQDFVLTGRMPVQERLARTRDPLAELRTMPGVGKTLAERLHRELGVDTLDDLEVAAVEGRLTRLSGIGQKRVAGIRQALAGRFARSAPTPSVEAHEPPVAELLDVDREYRELAASRKLPTIAPRRMNPAHQAWLPLLHTERGSRRYTALYSNTPRAHELGRTHDWVVVYFEEDGKRGQHTVVTESAGPLRGRRVVRGRESECKAHYAGAPANRTVPRG